MKAMYLVASPLSEVVEPAELIEALDSDELTVVPVGGGAEGAGSFDLKGPDGETRVEVRFSGVSDPPLAGDLPGELGGSPDARAALSSVASGYQVAIEPGGDEPTRKVFEALLCARALIQKVGGVLIDLTAHKLHLPPDVEEMVDLDFDIRDHLSMHAVELAEGETPVWVHTHGMEKFGQRDLEIFYLRDEDLTAAEVFLHELCGELALGGGPEPREVAQTSAGHVFVLLPCEEARASLMGPSLEDFAGHETRMLTVVSPPVRHNITELLEPYRHRFGKESPEESAALRREAEALLPAFKARFLRRGLLEPLTFLVRASFEVHPEGEGSSPEREHLWMEVLAWEEGSLHARLLDGATATTEWRKGAEVEFEEDVIDAVTIARDGRMLDEAELKELLAAERPI